MDAVWLIVELEYITGCLMEHRGAFSTEDAARAYMLSAGKQWGFVPASDKSCMDSDGATYLCIERAPFVG